MGICSQHFLNWYKNKIDRYQSQKRFSALDFLSEAPCSFVHEASDVREAQVGGDPLMRSHQDTDTPVRETHVKIGWYSVLDQKWADR